MAKMFYSAKEAAEKLGKTEDELKAMVRAGSLREFRDAGNVNYKVDDIDALVDPGAAGAAASGEIVLEAADDSGLELAPAGSDILSLEEADAADSAADTHTAETKKKEGTVVPSIGINVFDDDELDEAVDPLAQTAVTDVAGLEGVGSGSGILDLTRESDDTSLGPAVLDEIYSEDDEQTAAAPEEGGGDTRAGLEEPAAEAEEADTDDEFETEPGAADVPVVTTRVVVEYAPDATSAALTALMVVAVAVIWFAGLAGAGMVRGVVPSILKPVYEGLMIYGGGAAGVAVIAAVATYFMAKRSG